MTTDGIDTIAARMRRDPLWTAREILGVELWSKQREILRSVWEHDRTAVKSAHGVGKTYNAAVTGLTFLHSFPDSIVITTAPTFTQVKLLLWKEWRTIHERARFPLGSTCLHTECQVGPAWWAIGLSTDSPDRFVGHHSPHVLVIVDEAFGVEPWVFEAAETYMTASGNDGTMARLLAIGNPTDPTSPLAAAWKGERERWNRISISAFDSPAVSLTPEHVDGAFVLKAEREDVSDSVRRKLVGDAWILDKVSKWGIGSALWNIRVMGDFADSRTDSVLSVPLVEDAQAREIDPRKDDREVIACDPARFGDDETVIARKRGYRVRLVDSAHGRDTMATAGAIMRLWVESGKRARVIVDVIGLGAGICDRLREQGVPVEEFNAADSALERDQYGNARDELWFRAREHLEVVDLDEDERLAADLTAPTYRVDSSGRMRVEPKEQTKKRLGRSPDRADAVLMTFVPPQATRRRGGGIIQL